METKSKSSGAATFPGMADAPALWQSAFKRSEDWMKPGMAALEDMQAAAQSWMQHRIEDFQKAMEASRQMAECKDFAQAAAIQQKWLADCTQRLVADWTALVTSATKQGAEAGGKKAAE